MSRADYLTRQRWFAGSMATIESIEPLPWILEPFGGFGVRFELVQVTGPAGKRTYNVPASYRREPFPGLDAALMSVEDGLHVYDAMLDAHARTALLSGFLGTPVGGVAYEVEQSLGLTAETTTLPLVTEQSNTSIIVGDDLLWKLFRIVGPGANPDIEIGRALTATTAPEVAPVRGWMRAGDIDLAMVYDYYPTATDGWDSARASFRDLLAEPGLSAAEAGGDFAAEAHRLGSAVASIHRLMRPLGTSSLDPDQLADHARRLAQRFEEAARVAPDVARWSDAASHAFQDLGSIPEPVMTQRIHGDLHLGQTLRTVEGWKVFDFEGEPATPLADRARLDSPLRDVAGMLRSFDYASRSVLMQIGDDSASATARAADWSARNSEAFLRAYGIGEDTTAYVLLRCYQIDKAAYEVAYEAQHRPGWIEIPLDAVARLLD